jgi:hypothetical protein
MRRSCLRVALLALLGLVGLAGISSPVRAETGTVAIMFTKGGFILGVGGGEGVLRLRGNDYPFTVSGMSVGFTVGASTTRLVGRALNLRGPGSISGHLQRRRCRCRTRRGRRRSSAAQRQWRGIAAQRSPGRG